jgi:hypothetical protein
MKFSKIHLHNLFVLAVFALQAPASGEVVYDSLSTSQTSSIMIREIGNTVTLSGNKRFITSFTIHVGVGSSHIGQMNDYILRFYLPTAPGNYPGKLFWQSPPKTNVEMTGGVQSITFEVPYIRVPNTFIFSIMQAGDGYFPLCGGPVIGSSPEYCWTNLTERSLPGYNHLQVRIEAQDRTDAMLLGWINDSSWGGLGDEDYYTMGFEMWLGGYWDMFGPSFHGVTEWDEGSFLQLNATDVPDAVDYLTNGVDETLRVYSGITLQGNVESDTIIKAPGIPVGYPDFYGCIITDIGLKLDTIIIDHSTPGWTYFTSDVTWEIWGFEKSADPNLGTCWDPGECAGQPFGDATCDGSVDLADLFALKAHYGTSAPWADNQCCADFSHDGNVNLDDLFTLKAGFGTLGYSPSTLNQACPP